MSSNSFNSSNWNPNSLTDSNLVSNAQTLVREEREKLTAFLHHLKEIERRRLFSALGYKSLFEMTTRHFGYSEDEAYRRISAMKLLTEIPLVEEKISQGKLTLTHLSLAQKHFRQERKIHSQDLPLNQKLMVIEQISNTSVREAEKITLRLSSSTEPLRPDRVRLISETQIEMKFLVSAKTQEKIQTLKGLLAHKHPDLSLGELFDILCEIGLKAFNPSIKRPLDLLKCPTLDPLEGATLDQSPNPVLSQGNTGAPRKRRVKTDRSKGKSKAQIRREVFQKAQNKCEICGSGFALEIDHIRPRAHGGGNESENLRLLCRSCNQRAAIQVFGLEKMSRYLQNRA
jgi:hypothetical protein